jgi:hypothetical protein
MTIANRVLVAAIGLLALAGAFAVQQLTVSNADAAKLKLVSDAGLQLSSPNESPRAAVECPGKLEPYGGAQSATPAPLAGNGQGVYPHSYERLGAQGGFHSTPVLFDPPPGGDTRSYQVKLQVKCGKKPGKIADPHDIAFNVPSNTQVTLEAHCPKKSVLIGGGFQRAAFEFGGGVYPNSSFAADKNTWTATGTAFGTIRNDFVSIGYCLASPKRKPLIKTVEAPVSIAPGQVGFATTPSCSGGRKMVWSGFDTSPKAVGPADRAVLFADGVFNDNQSFTASAYNGTAGVATLTAYGYCMKDKVIGGSLKKFSKKQGNLDKLGVGQDQDGNPNG